MTLRPFATIVMALALAGGTAGAQDTSGTLATELFNAGRDLLKVGNYEAACPKLAESARLDPKVGTLARLAECDEKLAHLASARGHWQQAVNLARSQHDDRLAHAEKELQRIDQLVPKLDIRYTGAAPPGLDVVIDTTSVGVGGLGIPLPVDPGSHTLRATAPSKDPWTTSTETVANGATTIVTIPELADTPVIVPASPVSVPVTVVAPVDKPAVALVAPPSTSLRATDLTAIATGLVSAASIGIAVGYAADAKSKLDASNAQPGGCNGDQCPPGAAVIRNAARDSGTVATVFAIAGGALAAGAVGFWLVPRALRVRRTAMRVTPFVLGMLVEGTFQ